jgi:hypothetical protein
MPVVDNMWSLENVREQLRRTSGLDGASAQVFLNEKVSADLLSETVSAVLSVNQGEIQRQSG